MRKKDIPESPLVDVIECNLDELNSIDTGRCRADVFYHLGWSGTTRQTRNDPYEQVKNITYSIDSVHLAHKFKCSKYFHAGSQAEFGPSETELNSQSECKPKTAYGASKYAAGIITKNICEELGITHLWGRIFSVYGVHDNPHTLINYAVDKFLKNEPAEFSSCTQIWDYLFEDDAGEILYRIGNMIDVPKICCISKGEKVPLKDYISKIYSICKSHSINTFTTRKDLSLRVDPSDLFDWIEYVPKYSFEYGISKIVESKMQK